MTDSAYETGCNLRDPVHRLEVEEMVVGILISPTKRATPRRRIVEVHCASGFALHCATSDPNGPLIALCEGSRAGRKPTAAATAQARGARTTVGGKDVPSSRSHFIQSWGRTPDASLDRDEYLSRHGSQKARRCRLD
jgi:hypothetical protein